MAYDADVETLMWKKQAFQAGDILTDPHPRSDEKGVLSEPEQYLIEELVGRGSFAEVYRASRVRDGAVFAVKILRMQRANNVKAQVRHKREAELLLLLRHPNLVAVHAIIELPGGIIAMVMDLLVGRTFGQLQRDLGGRVPPHTALEVMSLVCSALVPVHKLDVVHRDIKPENIFICDNGSVRLCDLGASQFPHDQRLTTDDTTIGTVEYMSPEQLSAPRGIDGRSDLYSVGVVLYEAITGVHPMAEEGAMPRDLRELGMCILVRQPVPLSKLAPEIPSHVASLVERLLSKDPKHRYGTAEITGKLLSASHQRCLADAAERGESPPRISFVGRLPTPPAISAEIAFAASSNPFASAVADQTFEDGDSFDLLPRDTVPTPSPFASTDEADTIPSHAEHAQAIEVDPQRHHEEEAAPGESAASSVPLGMPTPANFYPVKTTWPMGVPRPALPSTTEPMEAMKPEPPRASLRASAPSVPSRSSLRESAPSALAVTVDELPVQTAAKRAAPNPISADRSRSRARFMLMLGVSLLVVCCVGVALQVLWAPSRSGSPVVSMPVAPTPSMSAPALSTQAPSPPLAASAPPPSSAPTTSQRPSPSVRPPLMGSPVPLPKVVEPAPQPQPAPSIPKRRPLPSMVE